MKDVGVIVALDEEFSEFLEVVKQYTSKKRDGEYFYHFEWAGPPGTPAYDCVAACVGAKGHLPAAIVTDRMIHEYHPMTVVIIGIAGGIDKDIRLGDVLVVTEINNYREAGKVVRGPGSEAVDYEPGGRVYRTWWPPIRTCQHLEHAYGDHYGSWVRACSDKLSVELDKLPTEKQGVILKKGLLRDQVKLFAEDVHLASGPDVGAAKAFLAWLRKHRDRNLLGLEMESGGFTTGVWRQIEQQRSLVLRGVSDYADERKKGLDEKSRGAFRRCAVHNATQLLLTLLHIGELPRSKGLIQAGIAGISGVYQRLEDAVQDIKSACFRAQDIKILANKGLVFVGTDDSLLSPAERMQYVNLKKIRALLLDPDSRWISSGFINLRKHDSVEDYRRELQSSHEIVEAGFRKFLDVVESAKSGVKYYQGEPVWRLVMTEDVAFVSSYADESTIQARDLPVVRFDNVAGSLYHSFKRHFNDIWHNSSKPGNTMVQRLDFETSAGGIVEFVQKGNVYIALLQRHDGYWVLPKGHPWKTDSNIRDTALREVSEEIGIPPKKLQIISALEPYVEVEDATRKVTHLFLMRTTPKSQPRLRPDPDHLSATWWPLTAELPLMKYSYQASYIGKRKEELQITEGTERTSPDVGIND